MVDLYQITGLIFVGTRTYVHYVLYNRTYFTGQIFVVRQSSEKTVKIGPLKNFPLYGMLVKSLYLAIITNYSQLHDREYH